MLKNILTTTWNGAPSLVTPDPSGEYEGRLSLLFKCMRGVNEDTLYEYLEKSYTEDLVDTVILCFNARDVRGGKGERELGRKMFKWLCNKNPLIFSALISFLPEYGRWDDLLFFLPKILEENQTNVSSCAVKYIAKQLNTDLVDMENGRPISLCAKWMPTENDSKDRKFNLVKSICKEMEISEKTYRTKYISPLRSYLKIVERFMCSDRWDEIEFSKVPSCAIKKLKKAFEKHTPELFKEWTNSLNKGEVKVNAKALFPHELVKEMREGKSDDVTYAQWKVLEDEVRSLGIFEKSIAVVDTSGSMTSPNYLPLDIACAMGLIISAVAKEPFQHNIMTFSDNPHFYNVKDGPILDRYRQIVRSDVGYSTNVLSIFEYILKVGKRENLSTEDMPNRIFIISDMQFNDIQGNGFHQETTFQRIDRMYAESNYVRPNIVFWNVNGASTDFPVSVDDYGTCMISGASPSILRSILKVPVLSSVNILRDVLDSERYLPIKQKLC